MTTVQPTAHVFSTFRDVSAALGEASLTLDDAPIAPPLRSTARRADTGGLAASEQVASLLPLMERSARLLAEALPSATPVDLLPSFAEPWSHALAIASSGVSPDKGKRLVELARTVFLSAAYAASRNAATESPDAVVEIARALAGHDSVHPSGDRSGDRSPLAVQSFVALAHTLPHALAGAWLVLASQPGAWRLLRDEPRRRVRAIDELLRLASPARAVFRRASADVRIGDIRLCAGDELVLMLQDANRCPVRFEDPDRFAPARDRPEHLGLGLAPHACAGGALVRLAVSVATAALLDRFDEIALVGPVTWLDGFAIRAPASLTVVLRHRDGDGAKGDACTP